MPETFTCTSISGNEISWVDEIIGSGSMKDVYFSPDRSYVVQMLKTRPDQMGIERLRSLIFEKRNTIFFAAGGDYWRRLFVWPDDMIDHNGKIGLIAPTYPKAFYFEDGQAPGSPLQVKGQVKHGKWFASGWHRSCLDPRELGTWRSHIQMLVQLAQAVRRMHMAGWAHSDLSYKTVLVDPRSGSACVIDVDSLVVPGKFPPEVEGTPDFIAPEVIATQHLRLDDPLRNLPNRSTDQHALAVLIYIYLLYRHPLRGGKEHDTTDPERDESLSMGEGALFVEHPTDRSNRIRLEDQREESRKWSDTDKVPYTVLGPYLAPLVERAFITGLHAPAERPTAGEWEDALIRTVDLLVPCANAECEQKWFVLRSTPGQHCPFCGTQVPGQLPIMIPSRGRETGDGVRWIPENQRLVVFDNQELRPWHVSTGAWPNERLAEADRTRVGYFQSHEGAWVLVNEGMPRLHDLTAGKDVPVGGQLTLTEGHQLRLDILENGGRVMQVQLAYPGSPA